MEVISVLSKDESLTSGNKKCFLAQECKGEACGRDLYVIPGYREDNCDLDFKKIALPLTNRRIFHCYLPFEKCKYDIPCIGEALHTEIKEKSADTVDIVGLSFGGIIAQTYTETHPEQVNKIVLFNTFSSLASWFKAYRRLVHPEHMKNLEKYNFPKLSRKIKVKSFVYNCLLDRVIGEFPQVNEESVEHNDLFCLHATIPKKIKEKAKNFLDN